MPRHRAGPRLYLKAAEPASASGGARPPIWIIRDGSQRRSTGFHRHERAEAEQALADYIASKYRPPTGLGQSLLVEEAIAAYLKDNEDSPSYKVVDGANRHTARRVVEGQDPARCRQAQLRRLREVANITVQETTPQLKEAAPEDQHRDGSPRPDDASKRPSTLSRPTTTPSWWCRRFASLRLRPLVGTTG